MTVLGLGIPELFDEVEEKLVGVEELLAKFEGVAMAALG